MKMGLTGSSTGKSLTNKTEFCGRRVALAGNPNVGKSTIFNHLTGLKQHTGNWTGKTVGLAAGYCRDAGCTLVDLPGCYSLSANSEEESAARDFICFGDAEAVIVVCDASRLQRNLNLLIQISEITPHILLCVNLLDEAKANGITPDITALERLLGIPAVGTSAGKGTGVAAVASRIHEAAENPKSGISLRYTDELEKAIANLLPIIKAPVGKERFFALRLLEGDAGFLLEHDEYSVTDEAALNAEKERLRGIGLDSEAINAEAVHTISEYAAAICRRAIKRTGKESPASSRADRILCGRLTGFAAMAMLLAVIFWITIVGANYPSEALSSLFGKFEGVLHRALAAVGAAEWLIGMLIFGIYRTLAWIVAVMLPPMAIFFPLFTLLEDIGYLPRIAYNLDRCFAACGSCGKQSLTMCMGLGCNAAGVVGARIIDSEKERLIAILTNAFMPCNGRFPALVTVITVFFSAGTGLPSVVCALILAAVILLGVIFTLIASRLLSSTILHGKPSSFILEMPPYRKPNIPRVIVRSMLDRTVFVLGRAVMIAIPAGLLIWLLANITLGGVTLLSHICLFLEPLAALCGMDGVILTAFLLGLPANEIVLPIILMAYTSGSELTEAGAITEVGAILTANGWSIKTALCFLIFSMAHFPCSTTLISVKKETGSTRWMLIAAALPTLFGAFTCMLVNLIFSVFS